MISVTAHSGHDNSDFYHDEGEAEGDRAAVSAEVGQGQHLGARMPILGWVGELQE